MDAKVNYGVEELNYLSCAEQLMEQVKDAENAGIEVLAPEFSPLQVHYRANLIVLMEQKGWSLAHWSVTGIPPFVCAYPIFVRTGKEKR